MVSYPVNVWPTPYKGADPRKLAKIREEIPICQKLEKHINELLRKQREPIKTYLFDTIINQVGVPRSLARPILQRAFGPSNGFNSPAFFRDCRTCAGAGVVPQAQDAIPASLPPPIIEDRCPTCRGTGDVMI